MSHAGYFCRDILTLQESFRKGFTCVPGELSHCHDSLPEADADSCRLLCEFILAKILSDIQLWAPFTFLHAWPGRGMALAGAGIAEAWVSAAGAIVGTIL